MSVILLRIVHILVGFALCTFAQWVNRTIDDQLGDQITGTQVEYSPASFWSPNGVPAVQPSVGELKVYQPPNLCFDGTWQLGQSQISGGSNGTISFNFNGTAVYVFSVAPPQSPNSTITFTIDGKPAESLAYSISSSLQDYEYNVPRVYTKLVAVAVEAPRSPRLRIFGLPQV